MNVDGKASTGGHPAPPQRKMGVGALVCLVALPSGGCALSVPLPAFTDGTPTGSISGPRQVLARDLDQEDWRRAQASMAVALDPQGNGALVTWANPATGSKGSFTASGAPRPEHDSICRPFRAEVAPAGKAVHQVVGSACRDTGGAWRIATAAELPKAGS